MKTIIAEEKKRATSEEVFVYKKIAECSYKQNCIRKSCWNYINKDKKT